MLKCFLPGVAGASSLRSFQETVSSNNARHSGRPSTTVHVPAVRYSRQILLTSRHLAPARRVIHNWVRSVMLWLVRRYGSLVTCSSSHADRRRRRNNIRRRTTSPRHPELAESTPGCFRWASAELNDSSLLTRNRWLLRNSPERECLRFSCEISGFRRDSKSEASKALEGSATNNGGSIVFDDFMATAPEYEGNGFGAVGDHKSGELKNIA